MDFNPDNLSTFLPSYLTDERKKDLLKQMAQSVERRYYKNIDDPNALQGDAYRGLKIFHFNDGAEDKIAGVILNNSCDIDPSNSRIRQGNINFSPLISLDSYREILIQETQDIKRVDQHLNDVRHQRISSFFYFPKDISSGVTDDSLVSFDEIFTLPIKNFPELPEKSKIFRLSDFGFYMFIFKLSYHFCRLHEGVDRSNVITSA